MSMTVSSAAIADHHKVSGALIANCALSSEAEVVHQALVKDVLSRQELETIVPHSYKVSIEGTVKLAIKGKELSKQDFSPLTQIFKNILTERTKLSAAHIDRAAAFMQQTIADGVSKEVKACSDLNKLMHLKPLFGGKGEQSIPVSGQLNDDVQGDCFEMAGSVKMVAICGMSLPFCTPKRQIELIVHLNSWLLQIEIQKAKAWAVIPANQEKVASACLFTNILKAGQV